MTQEKSPYQQKLLDPRWQKKRLEILNRDEWTCQWCCDTTSTLHVHHLKYSGNPWDVDNDSLLTLCEHCHKQIDENFDDSITRLGQALREKAFSSDQIRKLATAIEESTHLSGIHYEPETDIICLFLNDLELYRIAEKKFWDIVEEKHRKKQVQNV